MIEQLIMCNNKSFHRSNKVRIKKAMAVLYLDLVDGFGLEYADMIVDKFTNELFEENDNRLKEDLKKYQEHEND